MSPLVRGAWIEIPPEGVSEIVDSSPLVRGAWIEINDKDLLPEDRNVASRKRGVD